MKKAIKAFFLFLIIALLASGSVLTAFAAAPIDTDRESSLTLQYKRGDRYFEGLEIKTYRIADVFEDGTYELCGAFSDYPVNIYGVTSQTEWKKIASTLSAYAAADSIEADCKAVTDETGTVSFEGILPGMYLTAFVRVETDKDVINFESFLTVIPYPEESGDYNYDVKAFPKCDGYEIKPGKAEYKVVKQWKNDTAKESRPEYVEIDIIKDGMLESTQKLSAENNWSYSWTCVDDNSKWQAVERNVPKDYTVAIEENGNTIIVTNTYEFSENDAPQTGSMIVIWPYALLMCFSGGILLIIAVWKKRSA